MLMALQEAEARWDKERWPNFSPKEFACRQPCRCDSEFYWDEKYFDAIQKAREIYGRPIKLNCGHRCQRKNAKVSGAPKSQHLRLAFDISLRGLSDADKHDLYNALVAAGVTTFGSYATFVHCDLRLGRWWATKSGKHNGTIFRRVT